MKKGLKLLAVPALALTLLSGCGEGGTKERLPDALNVLPENVLNYEGDLDIYIYIEGQLGAMLDIGHKEYEVQDLWEVAMAKFYSTAKEFNKYVPGAKINLYYCSIADYNTNIASYATAKGHIPHIMHATDHVNEMIAKGYATDLTIYNESPYYDIFDESIMAEFNFGGFQGAIPLMIYPMGIFVNSKELEERGYIEYDEDYVENFTMESFHESMAAVNSPEIAGIGKPVEWLTSLSAPTIYQSFVYDQSVDLDVPLINELLQYESEIVNYSAYRPTGSIWQPKETYTAVHDWEGLYNFVRDEAYVFSAEMPWNVGAVSDLAIQYEKEDNFDLIPYPKANDETDAHIGMLAEGLIVGNQCPVIGEECSQASIDARDTAAYFSMFMSADPRAIKAKSEIQYTDANKTNTYTGVVDLPMVKRGFEYDWGEEGNASGISPDSEVFSYQLDLYLRHYYMYWDYDPEDPNSVPDVKDYTNLKPGFKKVLELLYDQENPRNKINFYGRPDNVPSDTSTKNILGDWEARMQGDGTNTCESSTWTGWVESNLSIWEQDINENIGISYDYLAEQMAMYYGEGIYFQD